MYLEFYGLKQEPFNLTPDPNFLFLGEKHGDAFKYLLYIIEHRKGFIQITGDVGTGKTTLCRALLNASEGKAKTALILNPYVTDKGLLRDFLQDLGVEPQGETKGELMDQLNTFLLQELKAGGNTVLIVDEAQGLSADVLEQIRIISNLETEQEKLLQIVLVGQPGLAEKLNRQELHQRIAIRYHLSPLNRKEIHEYIQHRLRIAGAQGDMMFTGAAVRRIFAYTKGIPRLINMVCDRALTLGYFAGQRQVTPDVIRVAISNIEGHRQGRLPTKATLALVFLAAACLIWGVYGITCLVWQFYRLRQ